MKQLKDYINEAYKSPYNTPDYFFGDSTGDYYKRIGYKYYNDMNKPSKEDIENAFGTTSNVTGDPSFGDIDGLSVNKIKPNEWKTSSNLAHALGGSLTNKEILERINKAKQFYMMLRFKEDKK